MGDVAVAVVVVVVAVVALVVLVGHAVTLSRAGVIS
jgi:hypothetical protein